MIARGIVVASLAVIICACASAAASTGDGDTGMGWAIPLAQALVTLAVGLALGRFNSALAAKRGADDAERNEIKEVHEMVRQLVARVDVMSSELRAMGVANARRDDRADALCEQVQAQRIECATRHPRHTPAPR